MDGFDWNVFWQLLKGGYNPANDRLTRARADLAKSREWDRNHEAAKRAAVAAQEAEAQQVFSGGEPQAPSPQAPVWTYPASQGRTGMGAPNLMGSPVQPSPAMQPARFSPPQRGYPGQGAQVRPMINQSQQPGWSTQVHPTAKERNISPQDYYALLQSGLLRLG